jgi:hypothetical protein
MAASVTAAWSAARQTWRADALTPTGDTSWTSYEARLFRYAHNAAYYDNTIYTALVRYAQQHRESAQLYRNVRGVYNPVARLVDLYVSKVYGGALDLDDLTKGAIPLAQASDPLRAAVRQLWIWSNWNTRKSLYVREGAKLGDVFLKVIDDRARQQVRLEVLHPGKVREAEFDEVGNIKRAVIEYVRVEPTINDGRSFAYTEEIDLNEFVTKLDGEEYPFYADMLGAPVSRWPNEYGFVPLVPAQHIDVGADWGATAFNTSLRKIDELNDAASLLNDHVRKAVRMVWWAAGVAKRDELNATADDRDKVPMIYAPAGSQPFPMVFPLDVQAALENVRELQNELERDMPELALHRIRGGGSDMTAPGVRAAYSDAIDRISEVRGNYNASLIRAQKMAVAIGGYNRYDNFTGFGLDSIANSAAEHYIADRPVIEDDLSIQEQMDYLIKSSAPNHAIWEKLDVPAQDIEEWKAEAEAAQDAFDARLDTESSDTNNDMSGDQAGQDNAQIAVQREAVPA